MEKRDSLVDLLMGTTKESSHPKPPSGPKPSHSKGTQMRRRASTVSSPYRGPSTPSKVPPGTIPQQIHKKRKSYEPDSIADASGRNMTDLKDELIRVCKSLRDTRSEKDELGYEVTRLRKLVDKKEKEVEDLLIGGYVGNKDRSRLTGASTKQDNLLALSSLKYRIHILERNLRIKEEELSSIRRDIKVSRLKELETEKEVYYCEIIRLQSVTDRLKSEVSGEVPQSKKYMKNKMAEQSKAIREMKEKISGKNIEVTNLKKQLGLWRKGKVTIDEHETDERKYLFSKYSKMTQGEVISRLMDTEMKVQDIETRFQSLSEDHEQTEIRHRRLLESKNKDISNLNAKIVGLDIKMSDLQKENNRVRDQCLQYRSVVENNRKELSDVTESLNSLKADKHQIETKLVSLKKESQKNEDTSVKKQIQSKKKQQEIKESSSLTQREAASIIQNTWKQHVSNQKQKLFERDNEKITRSLQSIFRSHSTRMELVRLQDINAVTVLQNIFRGHRTREQF